MLIFFTFSPTVTEYDPYDQLTVRALINLEWGMNIPVLTKLTPNLEIFNKMLTIKVDDPLYAPIVPKYSHITGTIEYLREWMNTKSFCRSKCTMIPPTWRNFIKILKDISPELSQVAYQIKDLFKGKHHSKVK